MKRFTKYMVFAASTIMAVACQKNDEITCYGEPQTFEIVAEASDTRAGYDNGMAHWDQGDVINVYLNDKNYGIDFEQTDLSDNKRSATFQATYSLVDNLKISGTVGAVYMPAVKFNNGGACRIVLPSEQTYVEGGYTQIPLLAKAKASTDESGTVTIESMTFKNYFAILQFNFTSQSGVEINSIKIEDKSGAQIAGRVLAYPRAAESDEANEGVIRSWNGSPADTYITLNCTEPVALTTTPTSFNIVVPSSKLHTFAEGLIMTIDTSAGVITKNIKALEGLAQNTIYSTPVLTINKSSVEIPDANFRAFLLTEGYIEDDPANDNAAYVYLTNAGKEATSIKIQEDLGIASLKGVENFVNLVYLYCEKNSLTTIDVSALKDLKELRVDNNALTSLDVSNNTKLVYLYCYNNHLTTLDVSACGNTLKYFRCYKNHLSALDISMFKSGLKTQLRIGQQTNIETGDAQTLTINVGSLVSGTDYVLDASNNSDVTVVTE